MLCYGNMYMLYYIQFDFIPPRTKAPRTKITTTNQNHHKLNSAPRTKLSTANQTHPKKKTLQIAFATNETPLYNSKYDILPF